MSTVTDIAKTCYKTRMNPSSETCKTLVKGKETEILNEYNTMFQKLKNAPTITKQQLLDFTRLAYVRAGLHGAANQMQVYKKELLLINDKFLKQKGGRKRRRSRRKSRRGNKSRKSRRKRRKSRKKRKRRTRRRRRR